MPIREDDPRPAYQQLADELRQGIAAGDYGIGDRLPSTRELSEAHGIALMTVRAAVGVLEDENLVVARQGRGVFVVATPEPPAGGGDLASVRATLEETLKVLQGINDRLDRYEAAGRGAEAAQAAGIDPATKAPLSSALDDLRAANATLDATGTGTPTPALDHHIDVDPPGHERDPGVEMGL